MKKILTFLVMLLISGSMLMAQNELPMFRYQAVLRDANNELVKNQSGTVVFSIDYVEWEPMEFTTNENGLVSLELEPMNDVSWAGAVINAEFTFEDQQTISLSTPVTVVPFALQAGDAKITTPMLEDYFGRPRNGDDVNAVYQALKENSTFSQVCRDSAVNYIKANYEIAKDIAYDYLSQVTKDDVKEAYDTMRYIDPAVKHAFYEIIKDYLKNHRSLLLEAAEYYISTANVDEAEELYNAFESSSAAPVVRQILVDYFDAYLNNKGLICNSSDMSLCDVVEEVTSAVECPSIESIESRYAFVYRKTYNPGTPDEEIIIDSLVYQVVVNDIVDLSTATVSVEVKMGSMGEPVVIKSLERVPSTNRFYLKIVDPTILQNVNTNMDFNFKLNKPGCQEIVTACAYSPVPNPID